MLFKTIKQEFIFRYIYLMGSIVMKILNHICVIAFIVLLCFSCGSPENSNGEDQPTKNRSSQEKLLKKEIQKLEANRLKCEEREKQAEARSDHYISYKIEKWKLGYREGRWEKKKNKNNQEEYKEFLERKDQFEKKYGPIEGYKDNINCLQVYKRLNELQPDNIKYRLKFAQYLEQEVNTYSSSEIVKNLEAYRQLVQLDPGNRRHRSKLDHYEEEYKRLQQKKQSDLQLLRWNYYESGGFDYIITDGRVRNISNRKLDKVIAVVTWYAQNGEKISSNSTLIDYSPLFPGHESHFEVTCRFNPAIAKTSLEFRFASGRIIPTYIPDNVSARRP